jgi:hypothetical protein
LLKEFPLFKLLPAQIPRDKTLYTFNLNSTVYPDFSLQPVVDKDDEAVLRHRRAIKIRLAGSEFCTREVSGKVAKIDDLYDN